MSRVNYDLGIGSNPIYILDDGDTFLAIQNAHENNRATINKDDVKEPVHNIIVGSIRDENKNIDAPALSFSEKIRKVIFDNR